MRFSNTGIGGGGLLFSAVTQGLPTTVYHDPNAPLWVVQHGVDYPGQSMYFVSDDGNRFLEFIETGRSIADGARVTTLERDVIKRKNDWWNHGSEMRKPGRVEIRKNRFVRMAEGASLTEEGEGGDVLKSSSLGVIAAEDVEGVLNEGRFHRFNNRVLGERIEAGDFNAVLAYGIPKSSFRSGHLHFPRERVPDVVGKAKHDERAFVALCILAGQCTKGAEAPLMDFSNERLAAAACYYEAPMRTLWQRTKDGDAEALETLRALALDVDLAVDKLLNLYKVWKVKGARDALRTIPIEGRDLRPHDLENFAKAGHSDAEGLLEDYDPEMYIDEADRSRWQRDLINSYHVRELGALVRHNNQRALDGLFGLHAGGHYAARLMLKELVNEGLITKGVLTVVDLAPLKARAHEDPMAVIALHRFHEDGHSDALRILRELEPVGALLRQASTNYKAIGAIHFLDAAGNPGIREGINSVSIEQWSRYYHLRGQAKQDGREARDSMSILARLGNEEACRYEGVAIPKRAMAAMNTLAVVEELRAQGHDVKVVASGAPSIAEDGPTEGNKKPSHKEDDILH